MNQTVNSSRAIGIQKRVSVDNIAVERKHKEWRDHRANLVWHQRLSLTYPRFRTQCTERTWHGRNRFIGPPEVIPTEMQRLTQRAF
jgi:hypothetical protein